ncbi:glycosyltransferase family 4 protein [Candidatus Woesearchaeota archaeon]|nr:glycosyltransferase family 4 protein [Candidatus Woesearchaeota archaeon]
MKKVLIVAPVYPLNQPDKEDYFQLPAEIAKELGFDAEILTSGSGDETAKGVKVKKFGNTLGMLLYIARQRPALVHTSLRPYLPSMIIGLLPFKKVHWPMSDILGSNKLIKAASVMLYKRYDRILAHTAYGKQLFIRNGFPENKVVVLPLPVNFDYFSDGKKTAKKGFVITCVANFRSIKGADVLLKAFSIFKQNAKNAKLALVGKDFLAEEGKPTISQMADKLGISVTHMGFQEGPEIKKVLYGTDVFCMASRIDAQCISVYEAGAAGLPLCLSDLPAFTSVFKDAALYHKVGDAEGLAGDLMKYYKDKKLRKTNGGKAKQHAKAADYRKIRKQLKELYSQLLRS